MQKPVDRVQKSFYASLYDQFATIIYGYLLTQVQHEQDAEDLLVEVFLAALNNAALPNLPGQGQLAWLRRVAHNKVIDRYRHMALLSLLPIERAVETIDEAITPEQFAERQEKFAHLYQAVAFLPALQRELLKLRYRDGLKLHEIAEALERPEGTVRKMLVRTLQEVKTLFEAFERGSHD